MIPQLLFLDVDGTLTDGKIYMGEDKELMKAFHVKDGCAIHDILPQFHITPVVITARQSQIVSNRCRELGIDRVYQNCRNKKEKMLAVAAEYHIFPDEAGILKNTAYMGDDILDLPCMMISEISACTSDASGHLKKTCTYVSRCRGGEGAVRDFVEWILKDEGGDIYV